MTKTFLEIMREKIDKFALKKYIRQRKNKAKFKEL